MLPPPPSVPLPFPPPAAPPPANPPVFCVLLFGNGDCSESNYCGSGMHGTPSFFAQGDCEQGLCVCHVGYTGHACEKKVECQYWDNRIDNWSTEGCVASPPPTGRPDGFLHCNCTHLTDFGGVQFPTSAEELITDFLSISFTVIPLDDMFSILTEFNIADNPTIFTVLTVITVADVLMILYNKFRGHRRGLSRGRAAIRRRKALKKVAREKANEQAEADQAVLAERRRRKMSMMGENTRKAEAENDRRKTKLQKSIQDRLYLDDGLSVPENEHAHVHVAGTLSAAVSAPVAPNDSERYHSMLSELLAPGTSLPALPAFDPSDGQIVPWAEVLEQRRVDSTPTKSQVFIQQRLPIGAHPGVPRSEYALTPVRQFGSPGNNISPPLQRASPFKSDRIPNLCLTTPSRLEGLRRTPTSVHVQMVPTPPQAVMSNTPQAGSHGATGFTLSALEGIIVKLGFEAATAADIFAFVGKAASGVVTRAELDLWASGMSDTDLKEQDDTHPPHRQIPDTQPPSPQTPESKVDQGMLQGRIPNLGRSPFRRVRSPRASMKVVPMHTSPPTSPPTGDDWGGASGGGTLDFLLSAVDSALGADAVESLVKQSASARASEEPLHAVGDVGPVAALDHLSSRARPTRRLESTRLPLKVSRPSTAPSVRYVADEEEDSPSSMPLSTTGMQFTRMRLHRQTKSQDSVRLSPGLSPGLSPEQPPEQHTTLPGAWMDESSRAGATSDAVPAEEAVSLVSSLSASSFELAALAAQGGCSGCERFQSTRLRITSRPASAASTAATPSRPCSAASTCSASSSNFSISRPCSAYSTTLSRPCSAASRGLFSAASSPATATEAGPAAAGLTRRHRRSRSRSHDEMIPVSEDETLTVAVESAPGDAAYIRTRVTAISEEHNDGDETIDGDGTTVAEPIEAPILAPAAAPAGSSRARPSSGWRRSRVQWIAKDSLSSPEEDHGKRGRRRSVALDKAAEILNPGAKAAARMSKIGAIKAAGALKSAVGADEIKDAAGGTAAAALGFKKELRAAFTSPKAFATFSKTLVMRGARRTKTFAYDFVQTARSEHTIANALAPPEEDVLGDSLQDEQIIHIFWTLVLSELCVINLLSQNEDDGYPIFKIFLYGLITSLICSVVAKILKDTFKFCNKKRRRQSLYDKVQRKWFKWRMEKKRQRDAKIRAAKRASGVDAPERAIRRRLFLGKSDDDPALRQLAALQHRHRDDLKKHRFKQGPAGATPALAAKSIKSIGKQLLQASPKKVLTKIVEVRQWAKTENLKHALDPRQLDPRHAYRQHVARQRFTEHQAYQNPLAATYAPLEVQRMRREAEYSMEHAIKIQSLVRQRQARRELLRRRKENGHDAAAIVLQKAHRAQEGRRILQEKRVACMSRLAQREDEAAKTLQKASRGRQRRQERIEERKRREDAALRLQKMQRGRFDRRKLATGEAAAAAAATVAAMAAVAGQPPMPTSRLSTGAASSNLSTGAASDGRRSARRSLAFADMPAGAGAAGAASACKKYEEVLQSSRAARADHGRRSDRRSSAFADSNGITATAAAAQAQACTRHTCSGRMHVAPQQPAGFSRQKTSSRLHALRHGPAPPADPPPSPPEDSASTDKAETFDEYVAKRAAKNGEVPTFKVAPPAAPSPAATALGAADADVFKNRFLKHFAKNVRGDGNGAGGDGSHGGGPAKPTGKQLWARAKAIQMMKRAKVSADEADRIRRSKLVPFSRKYILLRWTIGWAINLAVFVVLWLLNFMYGVFHGAPTMDSILLAWVAGLFQTFIIVEPSEVLAIVLIPSISENHYIAKCKANLKEYGFI